MPLPPRLRPLLLPVAAAEAPKPVKAEPKLPWVEAANARRKIPVWPSALVLLPVWAIVYATTNDPQSPKAAGPLTTGATVYTSCASCHGTGGGGVGPQLNAGAVVAAFPDPAEQIRWVMLGTAGTSRRAPPPTASTRSPLVASV
jgi:mono/diheme cytochrome c family protein